MCLKILWSSLDFFTHTFMITIVFLRTLLWSTLYVFHTLIDHHCIFQKTWLFYQNNEIFRNVWVKKVAEKATLLPKMSIFTKKLSFWWKNNLSNNGDNVYMCYEKSIFAQKVQIWLKKVIFFSFCLSFGWKKSEFLD